MKAKIRIKIINLKTSCIEWNQVYKELIFAAALVIACCFSPQQSCSADEPPLVASSGLMFTDSTSALEPNPDEDSLVSKSKFKLNMNHRPHPLHPYFRDQYRFIHDMRRLVLMFDHQAVTGYETIHDLFAICRSFSEHKQTAIICTALAGGVVNLLSEETNKQLRKKKINFMEWRLEKVIFRNQWRNWHVTVYGGMNIKGVVLSIPSWRIYYARLMTPYYKSKEITFLPKRYFGLNYAEYNKTKIITPFIYSNGGTLSFSYDWKRKLYQSRIDIRRSSSVIIRMVYINYLYRASSDRFMGEILLYR